jgi:hypothetical protein
MVFTRRSPRNKTRNATPERPCRFRPTVELLERRELLSTFVVTNTHDDGDGSLRQAILNANKSFGGDLIRFDISASGIQTISLNSALPAITDQVTIDGYTQAEAMKNTLRNGEGTNANLTVELTPATGKAIAVGLSVGSTATTTASDTVLTGLAMYGFGSAAIEVAPGTGGKDVTGVQVSGCFLGTDALVNPRGNGAGIRIQNSTGDTIGGIDRVDRNLISGNTGIGIHLRAGADHNVIQNNLVGTDRTGTGKAVANGAQGIFIEGGSGNLVGGPSDNHRNVVSGNAGNGVDISGGDNNVVRGNYIGTDVSGNGALGNTMNGVVVNSASNTVVRGNVIGANGKDFNFFMGGIVIGMDGTNAAGTVVAGNFIGVGADGATKLGKHTNGVLLLGRHVNTTIGGTTAADRNVISGNDDGIVMLAGSNVTIQGNYIGTNAAGSAAVPNANDGVRVRGSDVTIGGTANGAGNVISGNGGNGISALGSTLIQGNSLGVGADGSTQIGNQRGIFVDNPGAGAVTIGGAAAGARNVISGNALYGIDLFNVNGGGVVQGNFIGTDAGGSVAVGNGKNGVQINGGRNIQVFGNVISGNGAGSAGGVNVDGATDTRVAGNLIGLNALGTAAVPNGLYGVRVRSGDNTTIGGTTAADRNVISGNTGSGIFLQVGRNATIQGNFIGTNAAGSAAVPNTGDGVRIFSCPGVTVGGTANGAGNVISGNGGAGIFSTSTDLLIQGNYLGVGADGLTKIGNQRGVLMDISFDVGAAPVVIGGAGAGARNVISGNALYGIDLSKVGRGAVVQGNFIGTDAGGSVAVGNGKNGVQIYGGRNIQVLGNVISGNGVGGVNVDLAADTRVAGNLIGLNALGTAAVPNGLYGVRVGSGSNTTVGGTTAADRNVISGNTGAGVQVTGGSALIVGNTIGLDPSGTTAVGNGGFGVSIQTNQVTVGGTAAGARNVISGNAQGGVQVLNVSAAGVAIQGNSIGTNAGGTAVPLADPGQPVGVLTQNASGVTIGGAGAGAGNVISGNLGDGVQLNGGSDLQVAGNFIGTDKDGTAAVPNRGDGVSATNASDVTIGSTVATGANVISGNKQNGLSLRGGRNVTVLGNYIGTKAGGREALGNLQRGIFTAAFGTKLTNATIGGSSDAARNVIAGNGRGGIWLRDSDGVAVLGNYIGVAGDGVTPLPNQNGIEVASTASNVVIGGAASGVGGPSAAGRNLISGNATDGVILFGRNALVRGNFIGTDKGGAAAVPNGAYGVRMEFDSSFNNTVGGTAPGAGNLISGNGAGGVAVLSGSSGNLIVGNYIGTDQGGAAAVPNKGDAGLLLAGPRNAVQDNVISGNARDGVLITSASNAVRGGFIGTNAAGTRAVPNQVGVHVAGGAGTLVGAKVVLSGNAVAGVLVENATGTRVAGNRIGTNFDGSQPLKNGSAGVIVGAGAVNTTLGGPAPYAGLVANGGNVISGNTGVDGVLVRGTANATLLQGNFIGSPFVGSPVNNLVGVIVTDTATNTAIGGTGAGAGNVISGNGSVGISVQGAASGTLIQGNDIGVMADDTRNGNTNAGVFLIGGADTTVGASGAGRNVISNNGTGVQVKGATVTGTVIRGNLIGTNLAGTQAQGNRTAGIWVSGATGVTIGGPAGGANSGDRNVISGNAHEGILLESASGVAVLNNSIGLAANGSVALGNGSHGVLLSDTSNVKVGPGNVISGNGGDGVQLNNNSNGNQIESNKIGTRADGSAGLGNAAFGVFVQNGSSNNTIHGNLIAGNAKGVVIGNDPAADTSAQNRVVGNSIFGNAPGLGIDLGNDGVTHNTPGPHVGPNLLQNFPTLTWAQVDGANVRISGAINSLPDQTYRVEFFASDKGDPSGFGQGQTSLGSRDVTTNGSGNATLNVILTGVRAGQFVTATATDPNGNTSEFSPWVQVQAPAAPQSLPPGELGVPYSQTLAAAGGAGLTYAVTAGALPPWLTLDPVTGGLSGTPGPGATLAFTFSITATAAADPGTADTQAYTLAVDAPLGTSPNALYVTSVYGLLLTREPDPGAAGWVALLDGGTSPAAVVRMIQASAEYRGRQVAGLYQRYLHRDPEPGARGWIDLLASGWTTERVAQAILGSPEYLARSGGSPEGFVARLYQDVLGRAGDAAGQAAWTRALAGGASRADVAAAFFGSAEHREGVVRSYYQDLLGREVDAAGLAAWAQALAARSSADGVLAAILGSPEGFAHWW